MSLKIVVSGPARSGKTRICERMAGVESDLYLATLGVQVYANRVTINNEIHHLNTWDLAGNPRYSGEIRKGCFVGSEGVIIICNLESEFEQYVSEVPHGTPYVKYLGSELLVKLPGFAFKSLVNKIILEKRLKIERKIERTAFIECYYGREIGLPVEVGRYLTAFI